VEGSVGAASAAAVEPGHPDEAVQRPHTWNDCHPFTTVCVTHATFDFKCFKFLALSK